VGTVERVHSSTAVLDFDDHVYHRIMEPNTPPTGRGPLLHPDPRGARSYDEVQSWPQQNPPWAYQAAAKPSRGPWLIFAAIVIGCALIAGAIFLALDGRSSSPVAAPPAAPPTAIAPAPIGADNSTCRAWKSTKAALDQALGLPAGWNWDTPGIDGMIASRNAVVTKAMDIFEPQIADQPADVSAAAHSYVAARRAEVQKFRNHTYEGVDGVAVTTGYTTLNQLCGLS
jgi:hypothetical protein